MTQDEEVRRGMEAQRVMAEPLLVEAFSRLESGVLDQLRRVGLGDEKAHHTLIATLQTIGAVKGHLLQIMETGKMASITKEESKARKFLNKITS